MRSIHELRLAVAEYYFCADRPAFLPALGIEFAKFWDKMNSLATRGMTKQEWERWMRRGGHLNERKFLTQEEFDALYKEACSLRVE